MLKVGKALCLENTLLTALHLAAQMLHHTQRCWKGRLLKLGCNIPSKLCGYAGVHQGHISTASVSAPLVLHARRVEPFPMGLKIKANVVWGH